MKAWYESKTLWLNVITALIAVLTLLQDNPVIPPVAQPYILLVVGVLNVVLRVWFTDQPIG